MDDMIYQIHVRRNSGKQASLQRCRNDRTSILELSHLTYHSVGKIRHDCCSCHDDPILIIAVCRRFKSNGTMPCVLVGVKESEAAMYVYWLLLLVAVVWRCRSLAVRLVALSDLYGDFWKAFVPLRQPSGNHIVPSGRMSTKNEVQESCSLIQNRNIYDNLFFCLWKWQLDISLNSVRWAMGWKYIKYQFNDNHSIPTDKQKIMVYTLISFTLQSRRERIVSCFWIKINVTARAQQNEDKCRCIVGPKF